jgi:hypothetical protein
MYAKKGLNRTLHHRNRSHIIAARRLCPKVSAKKPKPAALNSYSLGSAEGVAIGLVGTFVSPHPAEV